MTKEEILNKCNFNLKQAQEIHSWLYPEVAEKSETAVEELPDVYLILRNNEKVFSPKDFKLEDIKCIAFKTLRGDYVGVYPKYKECTWLPNDRECPLPKMSEVEALFMTPQQAVGNTFELAIRDSEAAQYVRDLVCNTKVDAFLPDLTTLISFYKHRSEINAFAEKISDTDQFDSGSNAWSSCRNDSDNAWGYNGSYGFCYSDYFCSSYLAIPCMLL